MDVDVDFPRAAGDEQVEDGEAVAREDPRYASRTAA